MSDQPDFVVESLRQERLNVQKKTFTKWANIHLQKYGLQIDDLFRDLGDGLRLMKLLEALTGEKLGKPAKGNARINKIENVSRCLVFLHSKKMRLENISSEDIVDGKPHLILGLLWTIILRCEIWQNQNSVNVSTTQEVQPDNQQYLPVQKIAKDSLLLWCQTKTNGYPTVKVKDFHRSWRDGLAFNALIHSHVPSLVNFHDLKPHEHIINLENAFSTASKHIGVPRLLDPEDVDTDNPDEKSILIYVSTLSKGLASVRKGVTAGKRISNVVMKIIENDKLKTNFSKEARNLVEWVNKKVNEFSSLPPLQSLKEIQEEISNFKDYRIKEKPKRYDQKNETEALLFAIQMKRIGLVPWKPAEEISPASMERAWRKLERAEHEHEISIRNQLKEQERLENLAYKFESKRSVRKGYLNEMRNVLTDPNYGANVKQADATFRKHEAIRTGILSREIMLKDLFKVADVLVDSNYRKKSDIIAWKQETEENWKYVLRLLDAYDEKFAHLRQVISNLEETDAILEEMKQMQEEIKLESDFLDIDSCLQRQAVMEVQVASWGEAMKRLDSKIETQDKMKDAQVLQIQLSKLRQTYKNLQEILVVRRDRLEELHKYKEQLERMEEMLAWISEKQMFCSSDLNCKDLASALLLQKKHKALSLDIKLRKEVSEDIREERLYKALEELENSWKLKDNILDVIVEFYQFHADANDASSWISEEMHLLDSLEYGTDELTCEALLRRHINTEREISAYSKEISNLRKEAERIDKSLSHRTQKRNKRLQQSCMYFRFKNCCEEMEDWMREKERIMDTSEFGNDAEKVEKSFEEFITDLAAHGIMFDQLKCLAEKLQTENFDQEQTVTIMFEDVQRRWQHLNELTNLKERNLKGFTSLLLAQRMCDEASAWLVDKAQMHSPEVVDDITSFEILQRRQEALEKELAPAEERVKQAIIIAENVSNSYPDQRDTIQFRVRELEENWNNLQIKTEERKQKLEELAGYHIFMGSANSLLEWSKVMIRKLSMREKISDMGVAESVAKEHDNFMEQINAQEDRFQEVKRLGEIVSATEPEIIPLLEQLQEARSSVHCLWAEKKTWLQQTLDLQIFNREANQLQSMASGQDSLLETADLAETLGDMEILMKHHEAFMDTFQVQGNRYEAFKHMAESLIAAGHPEEEYIHNRRNHILSLRRNIETKAQERKQLLEELLSFQQYKVWAQEMISWIYEKDKQVSDLLKGDYTSNISYKMKRQQTFEAELAANQNGQELICSRGQAMLQSNIQTRESITLIIEELNQAWNELCEKMDRNRQTLFRAKELRDFYISVDYLENKIAELNRVATSSAFGQNLSSVKQLLNNQQSLENEYEKLKLKVSDLIQESNMLLEDNPDNDDTRNDVKNAAESLQRKLYLTAFFYQSFQEVQPSLMTRREKLEKCLKFLQFKAEVDRELLWILDQIATLSTDTMCRNLLDAQKLQKKFENAEVWIESHRTVIEKLLSEVLVLITDAECPPEVSEVSKSCRLMEEKWNELLQIFAAKKEVASSILRAEMFYCEAGEIDSWISEKLQVLSNADYGKDADAVIKLLTKHQALELEIDSYKGLVDELANQANALVESKHPDSKIIRNRMEVIDQEMKNIQKLCSVRRQKLLESKSRHEFNNETEELKSWINEQMAEAISEDYGEDYEHVLILHSNFEFYRNRVELGSKRIIQYEDLAKRLINSNCFFVNDVKNGMEYLSSRWSELVECIEARAFKMEAAAEIHRYHRDVTDILSRIHNYYKGVPQDLGNNLIHVQDLIKKHDTTENELLGIEAQVHLLLEDSQRLQETYPGGNEEHIQMQLALVIENWNLLQKKVSSRKSQLLASQSIHKYLALVREEENWAKEICFELQSEAVPRDIELMENDLRVLGMEMESKFSLFQPLYEQGESLLEHDILQQQIKEKLKSLSELQERVKKAWERRSVLVQHTKQISLFFRDAKQIQASIAKCEVQLCGSENKETVEDIDNALKKHLEFQKTMEIREEKFLTWKEQGESLLHQQVPESERIGKKIEELSVRRKRLLDFSSERSQILSDSLKYAKFKRDTIEAEAWIKEKKNKLRTLKDYNHLGTEEKIKCLQKQQTVQAELEAHEPVMNQLIDESKELQLSGEEVQVRLQLILEDWEEVKENVARMGSDLEEAREMLVIHGYFEKADTWIKEKELMIQANEVGKDYEHCSVLQSKLNDTHTNVKLDERVLEEMKQLAKKLARKEHQKGVYDRYERISDRYNWLKDEILLYNKKLKDAAEVHLFMKDVDDTIERIREKSLILRSREEVKELNVVDAMQRKLESIEKDLSALKEKMKKQDNEAEYLAEKHELSAGRIHDKINEAQREWVTLEEQLNEKKGYIEYAYTCLKYIKDANDLVKIINEVIAEMEFGEMPATSSDGQSLIRAHFDLKTEIDRRQDEIEMREKKGNQLLREPGAFVKDIENSLKLLEAANRALVETWENRLSLLTQTRDLQAFIEKAKQVENWLSSKEAYLTNKDIGDSMSSVEALIRKHENFEESFFNHFEKTRELEAMANDLKDHPDYELIESWWEEICRKRDFIQVACKRRKETLYEAKSLQQLLLNVYEVSNWMNEKIKVASDDSYKNLTNILSKTQKHAAFEAEILANHSRVVDVTTKAVQLIDGGHFAATEIRQYIESLENLWGQLMEATNLQKEHLEEANNALQFKHKIDDINSWLEEIDAQISTKDFGSDVVLLQQHISKNQEIQKEVEEYAENFKMLNTFAENFQKSTHLPTDEILSNFKNAVQRLHAVENAVQEREMKLHEALFLARLDTDINDELSWIEENTAVCDSDDYFDDLLTVQALQKELQALETEMQSRERLIFSVIERGRRSDDSTAEAKVKYLEERLQQLKDSISLRRLRLADALEAQTYFFEVAQAEMWIKGKLALIAGYDPERDIYSVQAVQKKLKAVEASIDGYRHNILSLQEFSANLSSRGHFDSENIEKKQEELNDHFEMIREIVLKQTAVLREKEDYYLFEKEVKEELSQINTILNVANSSDQGNDVEHVESLLQKFDVFRNKLHAHEINVTVLQQTAESLIAEGHSESQSIKELLQELQTTWMQCNEAADYRYKVLEKAKLIHTFNKSVDETVGWIYEKDIAHSSEDYGHDLESIKTLLGHHETLEGDLKAIEEQVQALEQEMETLSSQFPDNKEALQDKLNMVTYSWQKCKEKASVRREKLLQAEQLQSYFDEARDFHAWTQEMSALITNNEMPGDVSDCENLIAQLDGYKTEIDAQTRSFRHFEIRGNDIIDRGHFMADDIRAKINSSKSSLEELQRVWEERRKLYEQCLDLQLFKKKLKELEAWLQSKEHNLAHEDGESIEEVEYLLRKHDQFEKMIQLYENKFEELIESTKLEQEVSHRRDEEQKAKIVQEKLLEQQKLDDIKRKEEDKLLEERKRLRVETDALSRIESDEEFLTPVSVPTDEQFFKRINSKRSFNDLSLSMSRSTPPPIIKRRVSAAPKKFSVPPTTAEGFLDRKQELQTRGKRSTNRSWKTYYTVLCGQLLCFFKNQNTFMAQNAAKPPVNILNAICTIPKDYQKKKYVFRVEISDGSSFLFEAPNDIKRDEWIKKICYTSQLSPSEQLKDSLPDRVSIEDETDETEEDKMYESPFEESERKTSSESYDVPSNRSSLSNQSSYKTAVASQSSISTLQDVHSDSSEEEDYFYSVAGPTPRGSEVSIDEVQREEIKKRMSLPLRTESSQKPSGSKKRWKVFSLRRKN
ncbi:spectrin beta chain-like [Uloborus diversus]|uniref:spectrin beta chain-like n=1 Tax=Uloborus diversus TaxID=327109 RepID=UPI002409DD22|nr:spectrin beta chain-like [Uloborus diversus]